MNKISSITKALDADLSFYLFKGSELDTINLVSDYYKRKNINTSILNGSDLSAENAKDLVGILNVQSPEKLILFISSFDMISIQSQNILLKILENLGDNKTLIGICQDSDSILDTVRSRAYYLHIAEEEGIQEKTDFFSTIGSKNNLEGYKELRSIMDENLINNMMDSKNFDLSNIAMIKNADEYLKRTAANCNKELCLDLLIYKILEGR